MSRKLNDDLWLEIFINVVQQKGAAALFAVCSVNTQWRALASLSPLLWMDIVVDRAAQLKSEGYIQRFVLNSGRTPLHVTINLPEYDPSSDEQVLKTLKGFRVCACRMKTLRISGLDYSAVAFFLEAMGKDKPAPLLDSVHISVQEDLPTPDDPLYRFEWFSTSFSPAPNLRHLTLPPPTLPSGPIMDALLSSIPSLSIATDTDFVDMVEIIEFIANATSLTHFHFRCCDRHSFSATSGFEYTIYPMPMLERIDVTAPGGGTDLLCNIFAPSLRHIRLDGWREAYSDPRFTSSYWDLFQSALYISVTLERTSTRSSNLRSLHLEYVHLDKPDEEYRYILTGEWFPNLEELLMKVLKITDSPFIAAAPIPTPLKKLEIVRCKRVTASGLRAFVATRVQGFSLIIDLRSGTSEEEFSGLSELVQVELRSSSEP